MIKVVNNRQRGEGSLFHYAHFLCDCLFPEIVEDIYKYKKVYRMKTIHQTIGNFSQIYKEVMDVEHYEIIENDFQSLKHVETITYKTKEDYCNRECFDKFRHFIFSKFNIQHLEYDLRYPEVLLIKRNGRIHLIDDEYLKKINTNKTTGKERREIKHIDKVESFLKNKYKDKFASLYFERMPFQKQIKYFNNAKLIICSHGAIMSNMFFCKENTKIIEVTCDHEWIYFDKITELLQLQHIKCINRLDIVLNCIENNSL
jgi:hypothetical protein